MDREKVIKKAERIMCSTVDRDMIDSFCEDVIDLLKEREPVEKEIEGGGTSWWHVCKECHGAVDQSDHFCKHCGRPFIS